MRNHRFRDVYEVAARFRLYTLFRCYFQQVVFPGKDLVEQAVRQIMSSGETSKELQEGANLLLACADYPADEMMFEYNALFVGPGKLLAPPYESSYRNPEKTLMQQETLAVRSFYSRAGLQCGALNSIPDDHLALELEFICYLLARAGKYLEQRNPEAAELFLELYREFFMEHAASWIPEHCQDVLKCAQTPLCKGMAMVMLGFIRQEEQLLNELGSELLEPEKDIFKTNIS